MAWPEPRSVHVDGIRFRELKNWLIRHVCTESRNLLVHVRPAKKAERRRIEAERQRVGMGTGGG